MGDWVELRKDDLAPVLLNIGFGNLVASSKVVAIVTPGSAPIKRLREEAREAGKLVDATEGRRTRSIIITDSGHVILSALMTETIAQRFMGRHEKAEIISQEPGSVKEEDLKDEKETKEE
jgi:regulator of extracellular matrix RemA (YlzA/DUF370 family)